MRDWIRTYVCRELGDDYGSRLWNDVMEIIGYYQFYEGQGQSWSIASGLDYTPNKTIVNHTRRLINKVAGFMFSCSPEITLTPEEDGGEPNAKRVAMLESHIRQVLEDNKWRKRLINAGRDCFIGKRVALKVGVMDGQVIIRFRPAMEFYHDTTLDDAETLSRVIFAYGCNEARRECDKRIWIQDWRMVKGRCRMSEGVYDGYGNLVEDRFRDADTGLASLPCYVIVNDGTTSDVIGDSDVKQIMDLQEDYNRRMSDDQDALKFHMFPQTVFTDASEDSMAAVKISPGAMLDLQTDPAKPDVQAKATKLEAGFNYDQRFEHAVDRLLKDMYALESCPQVTEDYLKAVGISGKAMRAMYWDLQCRCEERWAEWDAALQWMVRQIVAQEKAYGVQDWTDCRYTVTITHRYPIADDEDDERKMDMQEVAQQVRSRKSYMEKHMPLANPEDEMKQIALEKQTLEEGFFQADM